MVINGDISEDSAKYQARALVDQLQSQKAQVKCHMIQQMQSQVDVSDMELLHVPIWFVRTIIRQTRLFWSWTAILETRSTASDFKQ